MYTVKMDVRGFGHVDATEVYAPLATRFNVEIKDLCGMNSDHDWHKLEVSGPDEKTVNKFVCFVDGWEDSITECEKTYGEKVND